MKDSISEECVLDDRYDKYGRKRKKENTVLVRHFQAKLTYLGAG
jgi:hypothetical protein